MTTPTHLKTTDDGPSGSRRLGSRRIGIVAGAVVLAAALTVGILAATGAVSPAAKSSTGTKVLAPGSTQTAPATTPTTLPPIVPLAVRSITPAPSATGVSAASLITVTFSVAPAAASPDPTLSPAVAGSWVRQGAQWTFHPTGGYIPETKMTVVVPASTTASEQGRHVAVAGAYQSSFTVGAGSVLRLQQMLAELHYLPFTFTRTAPTPAPTSTSAPTGGRLTSEPTTPAAVSTSPRSGRLAWAYPGIPTSLVAQWTAGKDNVVTRGAVMAFEADHGLAVDGVAGPQVWTALVQAIAKRTVDPRPYNYIEVSEGSPETLTVWQSGHADVYSSPVNTGVPGAGTEQGIFPVDLRYTSTTMVGTDVDGTKYSDPGVPWVAYFNGGDAIHGYPRASYGWPQSNGCVEMPIGNAEQVFTSGDDWYGTLVDVY